MDARDTLVPERAGVQDAVRAALEDIGGPAGPVEVEHVLARATRAWALHPAREHPALRGMAAHNALWIDPDAVLIARARTAPGEVCGAPADGASDAVGRSWFTPGRHALTVWGAALADMPLPLDVAASSIEKREARAGAAARAFVRHREAGVQLLPGAWRALEAITLAQRVWLVADGLPELEQRRHILAGLPSFVDHMVTSGDVGHLLRDAGFAVEVAALAGDCGLQVRAVIGAHTDALALAGHGGWPAVHICTSHPCTINPPGPTTHAAGRPGLAAVPAWLRGS